MSERRTKFQTPHPWQSAPNHMIERGEADHDECVICGKRQADMASHDIEWRAEFDEQAGYDCMTGAWEICHGLILKFRIDQAEFGQTPCDYSFRSLEAEKLAEQVVKALNEAQALTLAPPAMGRA